MIPDYATSAIGTYVIEGKVTDDELVAAIRETRRTHATTIQDFGRLWYESGTHTWGFTHFLGVGVMKCPFDLWIYQSLITKHRPQTIIETGTYAGGSALWYAYLMEMLDIDGGRVFTIDNEDHRQCDHPRITWLGGDSTDPALVGALADEVRHPLLISLDSDHGQRHVYKELCLYAPLVQVGEYVVVEDTNVSWPTEDGAPGDQGARGGVTRYLREHEGEFIQDLLCERLLLTMNPGGWLRRVATCAHAEGHAAS